MRPNVFELVDALRARDIPHALAHALHRVGDELVDHLEICLLLFPGPAGRGHGLGHDLMRDLRADTRFVLRYRAAGKRADGPERSRERLRMATSWLHERVLASALAPDGFSLGSLGARVDALTASAAVAGPGRPVVARGVPARVDAVPQPGGAGRVIRSLVVSIHDVAPATRGECDALRRLVRHVPVSLLAVPRYHGRRWDAATTDWLRALARDGDEHVVHCLVHQDARGRDGAEFGRRDSLGDTIDRVSFAVAEVRARGVHPAGFVAPAYAHPGALERALRTSGLRWWATRGHLAFGGDRVALPRLGLGASTRAHRVGSVLTAPPAARAMAAPPPRAPGSAPRRRAPPVPGGSVRPLLEALLDQDRTVVTHARLLDDLASRAWDAHAGAVSGPDAAIFAGVLPTGGTPGTRRR